MPFGFAIPEPTTTGFTFPAGTVDFLSAPTPVIGNSAPAPTQGGSSAGGILNGIGGLLTGIAQVAYGPGATSRSPATLKPNQIISSQPSSNQISTFLLLGVGIIAVVFFLKRKRHG
jgi:hypothetical protein